ncbi:lantibiotic dehydratase [Ktedonosporobacter rubrisoli]|nr:lantibiotic dehydratase [Ktedonosporobacter rubrisoli]
MNFSDQRSSSGKQKQSQIHLYKPLDFIQVRVPLFPIETYLSLSEPALTGSVTSMYAQDPLVRRALAVGSMDLLDELDRQASSPQKLVQRDRKLLRYLIRMATRPTPYGLFAGVSLAQWGTQTHLRIADQPRALFSRPDLNWLLPLVWKLEAIPKIRSQLRYSANDAAYIRNGRIFLLEQLPKGQPDQHVSVSIRATSVARYVLKLARYPISHEALVQELLTAAAGVSVAKAEELITTLWQHTLLFTDLHPPLTGEIAPMEYVLRRLEHIPFAEPLVSLGWELLQALSRWDKATNEESIACYRYVQSCMQAIDEQVETFLLSELPTSPKSSVQKERRRPSSAFVQTDTTLSLLDKQLARSIGEEAAAFAERLLARHEPGYLRAYRQAFIDRYGTNRQVPLLEVVDPQVGLGLPAFEQKYVSSEAKPFPERDREILHLALTALREQQLAISLDEEKLKRLGLVPPDRRAKAQRSLDLFISLAATSQQALARGEYQIVLGPVLGTMQAGQSLGRFASMLGTEALQALEKTEQLEAEQDIPHSIRAEMVYLSANPRLVNVMLRPAVHKHEIVYGVMPGRETTRAIPLNEIVLGVRDERFYLYWPGQQTEVQISNEHMLNPKRAPALIRFLVDLGLDGSAHLSHFRWGSCANFPFLPRLQAGRVVFSLAQWLLSSSFHLHELRLESPEQFRKSLALWRQHWQVPRYVYLTEADNRLLLDLEHAGQIEELRATLQALKGTETVVLQEALPGPEHAWLEGPGGHYLSEYIVSLIKHSSDETGRNTTRRMVPTVEQQTQMNAVRQKSPGSEWIFLKLYCGKTLQSDLIAQALRPLLKDVYAQNLAEEWFFIRYADSGPHIRLRFRGSPQVLTLQLLPKLCAWASELISTGQCLSFSFDSYEREIERYGGLATISIAETLFCADSRAVMDLLYLQQARLLTVDAQVLAVLTTDDILASLGLQPMERLQWYRQFIANTKDVGGVYRQKSAELRLLLGSVDSISVRPGGPQLLDILNTRRTSFARGGQQIAEIATRQTLLEPFSAIVRSIVHMHCNRLGLDLEAERAVMELAQRTWVGLLASHE